MIALMNRMKQKALELNRYFKTAKEEIHFSNEFIFCVLCLTTLLSVLLISCFSYLLLRDRWQLSSIHIAFFIVVIIYNLLMIAMRRNDTLFAPHRGWILSSFYLFIAFFLALIDTVIYPNANQIFITAFMIVAPVIYIIPFRYAFTFQTCYYIFFVGIVLYFKPESVAQVDILGASVGYIMSFFIYFIVMNARINEYMQKIDYKVYSELDALTGISNRSSCKNRMEYLLTNRTNDEPCAMIILDVDNFKNINDTLGHNKGDEVLIAVANILKRTFRGTDVVGRYGGDEFIVFLSGFTDASFIKLKCEDIDAQMKKIFDGKINVTCSKGICELQRGAVNTDSMFKIADNALYDTKTFNKGKYTIFEYTSQPIEDAMPLMIVVDDNVVDCEIIAVQFENEYRIQKFGDSIKALEYIMENSQKVDVVLLDMIMPRISGKECIQRLRHSEKTKNIPIVAISSDAMREEDALLIGADDMISKPIIPAVAKLRVKNARKKYDKKL